MILGTATRPNWPYIADTLADLPATLRQERERLGITVAQQAKQIGVTKDSLSRIGPLSNIRTALLCLDWLARNGA